MLISFRIRCLAATAATALALALGGFAVAAPAHAQTAASARSAVVSGPSVVSFAGYWTTLSNGQWSFVIPAGNFTITNQPYPNGSTLYIAFVDGPPWNVWLSMQADGNFVFYTDCGKKWGARTRLVDNSKGPGVQASFQSDGNLVVRNAAGAAIWASNTHTYPDAILAFQKDRNLVIYESPSNLKPLWATNTVC
jgi:hypothetical protein